METIRRRAEGEKDGPGWGGVPCLRAGERPPCGVAPLLLLPPIPLVHLLFLHLLLLLLLIVRKREEGEGAPLATPDSQAMAAKACAGA